jgi:hypothetical protein
MLHFHFTDFRRCDRLRCARRLELPRFSMLARERVLTRVRDDSAFMLVNSIDPLAPYKVSDDLILELVNVSAIIKIDPEGAAAGACWVQIVEPHNLTKHQPSGGYLLDNRQIQMTCAKSAGVRLGDEIKFRVVR